MSSPVPEPTPLPPRTDQEAADITTLVNLGKADPQPKPALSEPE